MIAIYIMLFDLPNLTADTLAARIREALLAYRVIGGTSQNLLEDFLVVQQQRQRLPGELSREALRRATNNVLVAILEETTLDNPSAAAVIRARFVEKETIDHVAYKQHHSADQVNCLQKKGLKRMARILGERETNLRESEVERLHGQLPKARYHAIFGFDDACSVLQKALQAEDGPAIHVVAGLGGVGKTSLAHRAVYLNIPRLYFREVHWLRWETPNHDGHLRSFQARFDDLQHGLAEQMRIAAENPEQTLTEVQARLQKRRYVIVIDDVEDVEDVTALVEQLEALATQATYLLTSRAVPETQSTFALHHVPELDLDAATKLVVERADFILTSERRPNPNEILQIYELTGGHPLALRIVIGMLRTFPLTRVVHDLRQAHFNDVIDLYFRIYQVAWLTLSVGAQALLQSMVMVSSEGAMPDYLIALCELAEPDFWNSIQELMSCSLVDIQSADGTDLYTIHSLTRSFLQTDVLKWKPGQIS